VDELNEREPIVAGQFYPANPNQLSALLDNYLVAEQSPQPAYGVMVPHAGYPYSGAIAGKTFSRTVIPQRIILIGPNHQGCGASCGVYSQGAWNSPLGTIAIDHCLAQSIIDSDPLFSADTLSHRYEHSLEVLLPFLFTLNPNVKIVPISLRPHRYQQLEQIAGSLARTITDSNQSVLVVASSDMSHFETADVAAQQDSYALEPLLKLDAKELYQRVKNNAITMCGMPAAVVMLLTSLARGATQAELVQYGHSGEVTGDIEKVVGYAGVIVR